MVTGMDIEKDKFISALNKKWLTPLYDPFLRYIMREEMFKKRLVTLADPQPGQRILDVGCGTGTLTLMIKQSQPAAVVVGLDADEDILEMARRKAAQDGGKEILWRQGFSYTLPFPDESFDLVIASMMLHHLTNPDKLATFREIRRVLPSGGRFWIVDFGPAHDPIMQLVSKFFSHFEHTRDHFRGLLPGLLREAGFTWVEEIVDARSFFGLIAIYRVE